MTYRLFLDDERYPPNDGLDWVIVRDFAQAVNYVCKNGFPEFVSFDHDLGEDTGTGYDFAKWLVERDLDWNDMPTNFDFDIHSQNPVGAANIRHYLTNYLRSKDNDTQT